MHLLAGIAGLMTSAMEQRLHSHVTDFLSVAVMYAMSYNRLHYAPFAETDWLVIEQNIGVKSAFSL